MEKYGVVEAVQDEGKTAEDKSKCPTCGSPLKKHGDVFLCPKCGSKPFEDQNG